MGIPLPLPPMNPLVATATNTQPNQLVAMGIPLPLPPMNPLVATAFHRPSPLEINQLAVMATLPPSQAPASMGTLHPSHQLDPVVSVGLLLPSRTTPLLTHTNTPLGPNLSQLASQRLHLLPHSMEESHHLSTPPPGTTSQRPNLPLAHATSSLHLRQLQLSVKLLPPPGALLLVR